MDRLYVAIKNKDHPHYPKRGYVEVKDGKVHIDIVHGLSMFTVNFDDGQRGMATYSDCAFERRLQIQKKKFSKR